MEIKNQVCSWEPAKELKELGVKQKSGLYWHTTKKNGLQLTDSPVFRPCFPEHKYIETKGRCVTDGSIEVCSAFTDAELEREIFKIIGNRYDFAIHFSPDGGVWGDETFSEMYEVQLIDWLDEVDSIMERADTGANAKAKTLVYLLKNKKAEK